MDSGRKKRPSKKKSEPLKLPDLQSMRKELDDLKAAVRKHKDILQVNDGWHSRISKLVGKDILFLPESAIFGSDSVPIKGKLLYADRYTLGIQVDGKDRLYNKGKVEYVEPA
jgi:hypothetical protein